MSDETPALTPKTRVSLPIAIAIPVLIAVVGGAVAAGRWMSALDWTLRTQGERLASIDGKLAQYSPAAVRDEARRVCRVLIESTPVTCSWVRGPGGKPAQGACKFNSPREERRDE